MTEDSAPAGRPGIPPLDQMPMLLRECASAAFFVGEKLGDELPVHKFTAERLAGQGASFNRAAEESDPIVPAFQADEANLRAEIVAAREHLEEMLARLAEAHEMETHWPCTGCHVVKGAAIAIAQERVWAAEHRLKVAEEALETMERILAELSFLDWSGPCEEVMAELDKFDPQSANEIREFFVTHREALDELSQYTGAVADKVDDLPRKFFSDIRGYVDEVTGILWRMSGDADDAEIEFRRLHMTEIMRLDEPRPGEQVWDIGTNGVTAPQVMNPRGPRNGGELPRPENPEEPHDGICSGIDAP